MYLKFSLLAVIALVGSVSCFFESRIVNGTATDISKYPFIASLRRPGGVHCCGVSIIAPRWVLTAAHCIGFRTASELSIQYATTKISSTGGNVVGVKRIIMHEDYAPSMLYANDIALLELDGSLTFNDITLAPVTLPAPNFEIRQTIEGAHGALAGWGLNATGGYMQNDLQEVDLKIYSDKECFYRQNGITTSDQICGGVDKGGKGQCIGDSGGPLVYKGSTILGIVSWSTKPCGSSPGVFTKVSHYINWIQQHIN